MRWERKGPAADGWKRQRGGLAGSGSPGQAAGSSAGPRRGRHRLRSQKEGAGGVLRVCEARGPCTAIAPLLTVQT